VAAPKAAPSRSKWRRAFWSAVKRRLEDQTGLPDTRRTGVVRASAAAIASGRPAAATGRATSARCAGTAEAPPSHPASATAAARPDHALFNPTMISLHLLSKSAFEQTKNTGLGIGQASPGVVCSVRISWL
jgi:hypothetical protein